MVAGACTDTTLPALAMALQECKALIAKLVYQVDRIGVIDRIDRNLTNRTIGSYATNLLKKFCRPSSSAVYSKVHDRVVQPLRQVVPAHFVPIVLLVKRCNESGCEGAHFTFIDRVSDEPFPNAFGNAEIGHPSGILRIICETSFVFQHQTQDVIKVTVHD